MNAPSSQDLQFRPLTSSGGGCISNILCMVSWQILKPVKGYPYFVSNTGFVYSNLFKQKCHYDDGKGYRKVDLYKNGKKKRFYVHRLVYETFCGELPPTHEVDHHNRDRGFNRLHNLRPMTRAENMAKVHECNPHIRNNLKQNQRSNRKIQSKKH